MEHDIPMVRGDTLEFEIHVEGGMDEVAAVRMTARNGVDAVLFEIGTPGGEIVATEYGWRGRIPPEATREAQPGGYKYDIQFDMADGDVFTPLLGMLRICEDQTREAVD